ncbi:MAG: hypothetical protein ISR96_10640 [Nitrospira sp.]|nr:hypothetical protein [bacterium]MBL7049960.1 hypothetical protein [Nitrospira sp.]
MSEVRSREDKPLPGIDYSEIHIPDENDLGTGEFTTVLDPGALGKVNPIISSIINKPIFQLIVNINAAEYSVSALLGQADNSPVKSKKVYTVTEDINVKNSLFFVVSFKNWEISGLTLNGNALAEK